MKRTSLALLCALAWACALPASAQTAPTPTSPAKVQGQETSARPDAKATTGKERARLAKAQNKPDCKVAKQDKPKKASAT
jgi:hypothetical protein